VSDECGGEVSEVSVLVGQVGTWLRLILKQPHAWCGGDQTQAALSSVQLRVTL
jgi:hypothetical protein